MNYRNSTQGFTLLELMITVVVIAILAAVAVPTYMHFMLQGRRAGAYALLEANQAMLDRCYAQHFSYTPAAPASCPATVQTSPNGFYAMAPSPETAIAATSYTLTAVPIGTQTKDTKCATFTLTSSNVRTATDSSGGDSSQVCWGH